MPMLRTHIREVSRASQLRPTCSWRVVSGEPRQRLSFRSYSGKAVTIYARVRVATPIPGRDGNGGRAWETTTLSTTWAFPTRQRLGRTGTDTRAGYGSCQV